MLQVLFPLLALVPRKEVSNDAASEVTAPLLGGEEEDEQGRHVAEDVESQLQAAPQANETTREASGRFYI
jgi:hypothetical protein